MGAVTLTISISEEDKRFLEEDGLLSPSKIFQVALQNIKDNRKNLTEQIKKLQLANSRLEMRIRELEQDGKTS